MYLSILRPPGGQQLPLCKIDYDEVKTKMNSQIRTISLSNIKALKKCAEEVNNLTLIVRSKVITLTEEFLNLEYLTIIVCDIAEPIDDSSRCLVHLNFHAPNLRYLNGDGVAFNFMRSFYSLSVLRCSMAGVSNNSELPFLVKLQADNVLAMWYLQPKKLECFILNGRDVEFNRALSDYPQVLRLYVKSRCFRLDSRVFTQFPNARIIKVAKGVKVH